MATRVRKCFSNWYLLHVPLLLLLGIVAASAADVKIRVPADKASKVEAAGGKLSASYEAFSIYTVPEGAALLSDDDVEPLAAANQLLLNTGAVDTSKPAAVSRSVQQLARAASPTGKRLHLVQFDAPVRPEWLAGLKQAGARIVHYVPENGYLIHVDAKSLAAIRQRAQEFHIQWEASYEMSHKGLKPVRKSGVGLTGGLEPDTTLYAVQVLDDPESNDATLAILNSMGAGPLREPRKVLEYINFLIELSPAERDLLAAQPDVVSIHVYETRRRTCERQAQIMAGNIDGVKPSGAGYLAWLASKGFAQAQFKQSDFVVDISDSGIDSGTLTPNHPGLYMLGQLGTGSRLVYSYLVGEANVGSTLNGCDGHGTLNAHILAGYSDRAGFPFRDAAEFSYGLGVCPFVSIGASVIFDPDDYTLPSLTELESRAYAHKARISSCSWGGGNSGTYDTDAQEIDALVRDAQPAQAPFSTPGNQQMVVVVAAGNDGDSSVVAKRRVGSPASAKNVITVGASEGVQTFGGLDGSGVSDSEANDVMDVAVFSSVGPTADGRHKPDLMAPGTHISGGVAQAAGGALTGTADACFNGNGISGGLSGANFFPAGQQLFTASSGTSHATPAISGACALLRQYFLNQGMPAPSPAMTKAWLMNSSTYMSGAGANDNLWSDTQGMGRVNLGAAFDGVPRVLRDQLPGDLFTASGQVRRFVVNVPDSSKPLLVTLAWTDAPGSTIGVAYNNDLNLTVSAGGQLYKGNVFSGAWSATGGTADRKNNVESVYIPADAQGQIVVTVTAANIVSDGVPQSGTDLDQDFALVVYNAELVAQPVLEPAQAMIISEMAPYNNAVDPGETVTVAFGLRNVGTLGTTNLLVSLQAGGGVVAPGVPQEFGKLAAGAPGMQKAFTFRASALCGSNITATLRLQESGADLGTAVFALRVGALATNTILQQGFETVSPPVLPIGWSTTQSQYAQKWVSTANNPFSGARAVYATQVENPGVAELQYGPFRLRSTTAVLRFRHSYDLEAHDVDISRAYDGGLLEVRIGTAGWQDIMQAGGIFLKGGYTHTIENGDNPLANRKVWSRKSVGYVTTEIALPAVWNGKDIFFRWRLGTDTANAFGGSGWFMDDVSLTETQYACQTFLLPPDITRARREGTNIVFSVETSLSQSYTIESSAESLGKSWTPLSTFIGNGSVMTVTNPAALSRGYFRMRSP